MKRISFLTVVTAIVTSCASHNAIVATSGSQRELVAEAIAADLLTHPIFQHTSRVVVCWYEGDRLVTPPAELVAFVQKRVFTAVGCTQPWTPGEVVLSMNIPRDDGKPQRVQAGYACGELCAYRATFVIEKRGDRWVVIQKLDEVMS